MKRKTNSSEDYFLGGRGLSGWVAALSAQASDMSGWLLMGLPGTVYALGTGQAWIAVGLFLGTVFNWGCISSRLRRYTIKANNSSWGVKCMGRAWFSIWTGCPHVSILEEGKNFAGAVAGIVSGGATVLVWDYLPLVHGETLGADQEILDEFDAVRSWREDEI